MQNKKSNSLALFSGAVTAMQRQNYYLNRDDLKFFHDAIQKGDLQQVIIMIDEAERGINDQQTVYANNVLEYLLCTPNPEGLKAVHLATLSADKDIYTLLKNRANRSSLSKEAHSRHVRDTNGKFAEYYAGISGDAEFCQYVYHVRSDNLSPPELTRAELVRGAIVGGHPGIAMQICQHDKRLFQFPHDRSILATARAQKAQLFMRDYHIAHAAEWRAQQASPKPKH